MGAHQQNNNFDDCTSVNVVILDSMMKELDSLPASPDGRCCIFIVHEKFRKTNQAAYTPELISIGPYHHGKFQEMEIHKLRYTDEILDRTGNKKEILLECVEAVSTQEDDIRKCYAKEVELDRDKFIKMMVYDALFIIQLFGKTVGEEETQPDDPIFNSVWIMSSLVRDIVLLENQLPIFVLEKLFGITMRKFTSTSLTELAIRFFNPLMPTNENVLANYFNSQKHINCTANHLLDLVSKTFDNLHRLADPKLQQADPNEIDLPKFREVPCVKDLRQRGIKIKRRHDSGNFLDIKFKEGVLEIPPILIQDQTDSLLRNLIALEQCSDGRDAYITSYALLMNSLIRSSNDAGFLRKVGIITNYLGDNECVFSLFNKLSGEVTVVDFHYSDLCYQLNACYTKRQNGCFAVVRLEYMVWEWMVNSFKVHGKLFCSVL